jgi:hypothetical protein
MSKPTGKLIEHWRQFGLPGYAQFNNDTVFQGPYAHSVTIGRVKYAKMSSVTIAFSAQR